MSSNIIYPLHYLIVRREGTTWYFRPGIRVFYNPKNVPVSLALEERLHRFGASPESVMIALFRLAGGNPGYYLADLKHKKYYYCGLKWEDVKAALRDLGIGRVDPLE